jgi:hypothetical protein
MESSPLMLKNCFGLLLRLAGQNRVPEPPACFGLLLRLAGQNRVPEPPAIMTTYIFYSSLFTWQSYS